MKRIITIFFSLFFCVALLGQAGRLKELTQGSSSGGAALSTLDSTFTNNYTAFTDSVINILTSITESNDIVVTLPAPGANTVGIFYTINQIDRNADGLGFTLVQTDGVSYDFYYNSDTIQFLSFTFDIDEGYEFRTIYLNNAYRWLATKTKSVDFVRTSDFKRLSEAIQKAKLLHKELIINNAVTLLANTTIDTLLVRVEKNGIFNLNGFTLTFGSATHNKGRLIAGNQKIFSDTIGVYFKTGIVDKVNVMWWGAKPTISGVSGPIDVSYGNNNYSSHLDNAPFFRAAANSIYETNSGKGYVYVPTGAKNYAYRIASPIYLGADSLFFGTVSIGGELTTGGFAARSKIIADFKNGPAISIEGQRGAIIENLSILGMNGVHIVNQVTAGEDSLGAYWGAYGYAGIHEDSIYSGIAIDAISGTARKTSDVVIRNCNVMGFNVGVMVSQAGDLQGDLVTIMDNYFYANSIGIGIGDDQSRSVESYANSFTRGHTAFSNQILSEQGEAGVSVTGGWVISHYQIASGNTNTCGIFHFENLYGEANGRIANFSGSNSVPCAPITFSNCVLRTFYSDNEGYQNTIPYSLLDQNGMPVAFVDCTIGVSDEGPPYVLFNNYNSSQLVFVRTMIEQNSNTTNIFNTNQLIFSSPNLVDIEDYLRLSYNGLSRNVIIREKEFNTTAVSNQSVYVFPYLDVKYIQGSNDVTTLTGADNVISFEPFNLGLKSVNESTATWSNDTLNFTLIDNNFELGELFVGDVLYATYTDLPGWGNIPALYVVAANRTTKIYKAIKMHKGVSASIVSNNFYIKPPTFAKVGLSASVGDFSAGSNLVTNVTNISQFEVGDFLFSDMGDYGLSTDPVRNGFTRVDSIYGTTLRITASAKITTTGRLIHKHMRLKNSNRSFQELPGNVLYTPGSINVGGDYLGITNPRGGTNTIQSTLDSLNAHIATLESELLPKEEGIAVTTVGVGTTLVINHNLGTTPNYISIVPGGDIGSWYVDTVNGTTMTLNYTSTATTTISSVNIYWKVK